MRLAWEDGQAHGALTRLDILCPHTLQLKAPDKHPILTAPLDHLPLFVLL